MKDQSLSDQKSKFVSLLKILAPELKLKEIKRASVVMSYFVIKFILLICESRFLTKLFLIILTR